jgi:hypothetical protein
MSKIIKNLFLDVSKKIDYLHRNKSLHSSSINRFNKLKNKFEKEIIKKTYKYLLIQLSDKFRKIKLKYFKMGKLNPTYLLGFNDDGVWNSNSYYSVGDVVKYGGIVY